MLNAFMFRSNQGYVNNNKFAYPYYFIYLDVKITEA